MRLINADALMELARNHVNRMVDCNDIARFPTIDAAPFKTLSGVCKHRHVACVDSDNRVYDHVCRKTNPNSFETCSPETCPLIEALRRANAPDKLRFVHTLPTIDATPVEHARWITSSDIPDTLICPVCGRRFDMYHYDQKDMPYCLCGAKMDGGAGNAAD